MSGDNSFLNKNIFISPVSAWAPGIVTQEDWINWAENKKQISCTKDAPKLEYTDALFRRRLSQISKMTIQVVHDTLEKTNCGNIKQIFVSLRGEITREFTINRSLISDGMILPAAFSLSVFNAPIALASLAFKLKKGYSVLFPSKGDFISAFKTACAPILSGNEKSVMFIYADELVPEEYGNLRPQINEPLAFAFVISDAPLANEACSSRKISLADVPSDVTPHEFLRDLLLRI